MIKSFDEYLMDRIQSHSSKESAEVCYNTSVQTMLNDLALAVNEQEKRIEFIMENTQVVSQYEMDFVRKPLKELYEEHNPTTK